jgi:rod shape-determining protein MreC
VYLNSSNEIVGRIYALSGNIVSYFGLRETNEDLLKRNAELQDRIIDLNNYIHCLEADTMRIHAFVQDSALVSLNSYDHIIARVINNSISHIENYITIDKGSEAGIAKEMGVVSQQGIVGIVRAVSKHYAVVQPIINPKTILSCKVKGYNTPGSLVWTGEDYKHVNLEGFPHFEKFEKGDTVITSGYSGIFPEGVIIGIIGGAKKQSDDNFITLNVKLSTNFSTLKDVIIIKNNNRQEIIDLEKEISNDK